MHEATYREMKVKDISPADYNPRTIAEEALDGLGNALDKFGLVQPLVWNERTRTLVGGHQRLKVLISKGVKKVTVAVVDLSETDEKALNVSLNNPAIAGQFDDGLQSLLLELQVNDEDLFSDLHLEALLDKSADRAQAVATLQQRFVVPPLSVLDAKQGYWQDRKRAWLNLGIDSVEGREQDLALGSGDNDVGHKIRAAGSTTSVFDPVLCEVAYKWFCPPGGRILDPFAGGSVRGVVAARLGYHYTGVEIRPEQVEANRRQWEDIGPAPVPPKPTIDDNIVDRTPIEEHGGYLVKRDDAFVAGGQPGGKARTCYSLAKGAPGLVTAGSRQSPQVNIVAGIAKKLGVPCRVHVPAGDYTPELWAAEAAGAEVVQHTPGHNSVIVKRARDDAKERGWREIPFGMECEEAVTQTRGQVADLPAAVKRIVIPVGSGMSLAGLLHGLRDQGLEIPVLGVRVGAAVTKRLNKYAPDGWKDMVTIVKSKLDYHAHAPDDSLGSLVLDPVYEAKCLPFLEEGDLLWVVGCRETTAVKNWARERSPTAKQWKFSAKWGQKRVNCTLDGIQKVCGGICCSNPKFWPPKSGTKQSPKCDHLGVAGCTLAEPDKPFTCLLYPYVLNKSDTLVMHRRVPMLSAPCGKNYGNGPMLVEAVHENLVTLFGQVAADRVLENTKAGIDTWVDVTARMVRELAREKTWTAGNVVPKPRRSDEDLPHAIELTEGSTEWILGDSAQMDELVPTDAEYDMIWACPPYFDLEVYSDNEADGSVFKDYDKFIHWYREIFRSCVARLKENRFLAVVVGEVRAKTGDKGAYRGFVPDTIRVMTELGLHYYNEAILLTMMGSVSLRAAPPFKAARKLGKTHQNVLVFYKGNPRQVGEHFPVSDLIVDSGPE